MQAAECFVQLFTNLVTYLKPALSEPPLLALSVCISVLTTAALRGLCVLCGPVANADVPSTFMERRLKRIALLRSWFRDKNCIFKLTFARIGAKRYRAVSLLLIPTLSLEFAQAWSEQQRN